MSNWKPIKTAPKDDRWIITYTPGTYTPGAYTPIKVDYRDGDDKSPYVGKPTHWMPLPAPPDEEL